MAKQTTTPPAAPAPAKAPTLYGLGKPYNVRPNTQNNNADLWQATQALLAANGGTVTHAQLHSMLVSHNRGDFAGYVIRRGWLAPAKA